jgi:hypothetical protein
MRLYVNKYALQDFYGRYGYEYHELEGDGGDPYITDSEGNEVATAPHHDKDYFEGDDAKAMNRLADQLKSQGVLSDMDDGDMDDGDTDDDDGYDGDGGYEDDDGLISDDDGDTDDDDED